MKFSFHRFSLWGCVGWGFGNLISTKNPETVIAGMIILAASITLTILYLEAFGKLKK